MSVIPPAQAKAQIRATAMGLYLHVPFCSRTCDYCAFYQISPRSDDIRAYLDGIEREGRLVTWPERIDTVFWGGGTPGLLAADDLRRLGKLVKNFCGNSVPVEWTVEMAPAVVTEARLAALKELGVNRISIGVQSFQPKMLEALGRQHTVAQVHRAYERVRAAGFANVNIDMMFALPGQEADAWNDDLRQACALKPEHISTYCLTFEEDTKLWLQLAKGTAKRDLEREAELYRSTWRNLAEAGYVQYEVSNFARPGYACLHNLNTWRMEQWLGLGPSAASQYDWWRGSNVADLRAWQDRVANGVRADVDRRQLSPALLAEDALIFGLRMNEGVDVANWEKLAPQAPWERVVSVFERLEAEGCLVRAGSIVRLTDEGRLVADAVGAEIVGLLSE